MNVELFYTCQSTGDDVLPYKAEFNRNKVVELAHNVLKESDDFIGITDSHDTTVQFYFYDDANIMVDMPSPKEDGSYSKFITLDDIESIILSLPDIFTKDCIPDLKFSEL